MRDNTFRPQHREAAESDRIVLDPPVPTNAAELYAEFRCTHGESVGCQAAVEGTAAKAIAALAHRAASLGYLTNEMTRSQSLAHVVITGYDLTAGGPKVAVGSVCTVAYNIPDARAWRWWVQAAELRPIPVYMCEPCEWDLLSAGDAATTGVELGNARRRTSGRELGE